MMSTSHNGRTRGAKDTQAGADDASAPAVAAPAPARPEPAPSVAGETAYAVPRPLAHIDLPLAGTERPMTSEALREFSQGVDHRLSCHYPDVRVLELALSARHGVDAARVMVTAGADEGIDRLCRAVLAPGRELLMPTPTFEMIGHYARLTGASVASVAWESGDFPVDALLARASAATRMVAVVTPNNPNGLVASDAALQRLAAALPHAVILVDMAYGEYAEHDTMPAAARLPNAVAVGTFSKAWGLPGIRVGYAIGAPQVIAWMRAAGGPYSVSRPSVAFALARLKHGVVEMEQYVAGVRRERDVLCATLRSLGATAQPSQANFVLVRHPKAAWLREALAGLGISVRVFPKDRALDDAVRITCPGDQAAFARLIAALHATLTPEALIFDLDGVLADVSGSYREAIIQTSHSFGVEMAASEIAAAKARGDANNDWLLTQRLLAAHGVEASFDEVKRRFERLYQGGEEHPGLRATERLIPSRAALEVMARRLPLAIVTGRPRADADRFLQRAGIADLIRCMVCMEDAPLKPDPAPVRLCLQQLGVAHAWMVGDTPDDVRAARGAGVVPVGIPPPGDDAAAVTASLVNAGAARVLRHFDELMELLG